MIFGLVRSPGPEQRTTVRCCNRNRYEGAAPVATVELTTENFNEVVSGPGTVFVDEGVAFAMPDLQTRDADLASSNPR